MYGSKRARAAYWGCEGAQSTPRGSMSALPRPVAWTREDYTAFRNMRDALARYLGSPREVRGVELQRLGAALDAPIQTGILVQGGGDLRPFAERVPAGERYGPLPAATGAGSGLVNTRWEYLRKAIVAELQIAFAPFLRLYVAPGLPPAGDAFVRDAVYVAAEYWYAPNAVLMAREEAALRAKYASGHLYRLFELAWPYRGAETPELRKRTRSLLSRAQLREGESVLRAARLAFETTPGRGLATGLRGNARDAALWMENHLQRRYDESARTEAPCYDALRRFVRSYEETPGTPAEDIVEEACLAGHI